MQEEKGIIRANQKIAADTYEMVIQAEMTKAMEPGQFVEIRLPEFSLRRPISIASINEDTFTIVYKVVGDGTEALSHYRVQDELDLFGPAGHGFPIHEEKREVLLIGGGVGVPPLFEVAKRYRDLKAEVKVVLGFNDADAVFYEAEFQRLGAAVCIATMDGSLGCQGTVMDAICEHGIDTSFVYACGPKPMLEAVEAKYQEGYISHEARMACGMGACMACVCKEKKQDTHYRRICKDGPVFQLHEVIV